VIHPNGGADKAPATVVKSASETNVQAQQKPQTAAKTNKTASSQQNAASAAKAEGKVLTVSATAYTAYCNGCSGITATGIDLRSNPNQKVIAVDPSVIPLGSKVYVEGYGHAIAGDTGGAIKGNKIDLFIPSKDAALQWGRKQVKVTVLD
jgi:3D (Asp-Asp-Asp) domain-containing protein